MRDLELSARHQHVDTCDLHLLQRISTSICVAIPHYVNMVWSITRKEGISRIPMLLLWVGSRKRTRVHFENPLNLERCYIKTPPLAHFKGCALDLVIEILTLINYTSTGQP